MTVSREDLERSISALREDVADPRAGLYGPDTISWEINREIVVFLAGGRAALLQLAHPAVAHAVDRHSATRHDPVGRFQRTFQHVYAMTFGDLDHAVRSARRVHAIHQRIYGTADDGTTYEANDEDALFWVYATLTESAVLAFEAVIRPLSQAEKNSYLREGHRFARLFAIPDALLPESWSRFEAYMHEMSHRLRVTEPAREMASFLLRAPIPILGPAAGWYRLITTAMLPEPVRRGFGFRYGRAHRAAYAASLKSLAVVYRALPERVRFVPAYTRALSRLDGQRRDDRVAAWLERMLLEPGALGRGE